jgi:hypothetical protein
MDINKFDTLIESVLSEGKKPRKGSFKALGIGPDDLRRMFKQVYTQYFDEVGFFGDDRYMSDKEMWEKHGLRMDGSYSSGYQQDPKWKGYLDVEIDQDKLENPKDITAMFKEFRQLLKNRY